MIKGRATIQLFDEKTGEVVHELHEENMITNAVDTILNPPDYIEIGMDSDNDRSFNMLRGFASALFPCVSHFSNTELPLYAAKTIVA